MLRAENVGNIKQQTVENVSFTRPNVNLLDCRINREFLAADRLHPFSREVFEQNRRGAVSRAAGFG